ncbi:TPA: winged helix-turn-helix domain-containing protein [Klebsiella aerogenes]|nr:winged helix-turn-helix domain-containing protein [Klebsiella aerogenes]HBY1606785.1 winged helix-turn-helix domain-containing protein [Klebsiella aerogenes]HBY1644070.1 winged helix-turn-helix domain-containing protein [Klebsiella aerogenes]
MSKKSLINGQVWFDPDELTLNSVQDPTNILNLPIPAGRCLYVLLQNHGEIVTIKQFHEWVWKDNNTIVSDNTVYQNISMLRKSLSKMGLTTTIIETQTRKGWRIPLDVTVINTNEFSEVMTRPEPEPEPEPEPARMFENYGSPFKQGESYLQTSKKEKKAFYFKVFIRFSIFVFFITFVGYLFNFERGLSRIQDSSLNEYREFGKLGKCNLLRNASYEGNKVYFDLLKKNDIRCAELTWWYITIFSPSGPKSIIMCNKAIESRDNIANECYSYYFRAGG